MDRYKAFYQSLIDRNQQKRYIQSILDEYKDKEPNAELFKELHERLSWEKHLGKLRMPFQLIRRKTQRGEPYFEVLLESKV